MPPPLIPYARHWLGRAEERAVRAVLRSGCLTQGPRAEALERAFARRLGRRHAVAVSSGTAALHCAIKALRLTPGSEVVTTPLTFAATANVLIHAGLAPRFCDVDPASGVLTPDRAAAAISRRTAALLPVDYAGFPSDGAGFRALARRHGLALIEDATHLLGGRQRGRAAGGWADVAAFSLHPSKAIAAGEGGVLVTDDAALAERARRMREHGFARAGRGAPASRRDIEAPGLNYRLSEIHSALALVQLERLGFFIRRRAALAQRYLSRLSGWPWIDLPALPLIPGDAHAWHLFVIRLRARALRGSRDQVLEALRRRGVGTQVHYRPVCAYRYYRRRWPAAARACPAATVFARRCLSLPLFPALRPAQHTRVMRALKQVLIARARK
jgi:dTDP-4-amino-4,6-dideoxygalactose transaminase